MAHHPQELWHPTAPQLPQEEAPIQEVAAHLLAGKPVA